jgi:hypothetical protein
MYDAIITYNGNEMFKIYSGDSLPEALRALKDRIKDYPMSDGGEIHCMGMCVRQLTRDELTNKGSK